MIVLDDYIDVDAMDVVDWSPVLALTPNDGDIEKLYAALKGKHPALDVYRSSEIPAEYRLAGHPRLPAVVGIAKEGWYITSKSTVRRWAEPGRRAPGGEHGYDATRAIDAGSVHRQRAADSPRPARSSRSRTFTSTSSCARCSACSRRRTTAIRP